MNKHGMVASSFVMTKMTLAAVSIDDAMSQSLGDVRRFCERSLDKHVQQLTTTLVDFILLHMHAHWLIIITQM